MIGPAWLDVLPLLVNVATYGGHDGEALARQHLSGAPPQAVTGALAGITGYLVDAARRTAPQGLPTIREFQRRQGEAALAWLRQRLR